MDALFRLLVARSRGVRHDKIFTSVGKSMSGIFMLKGPSAFTKHVLDPIGAAQLGPVFLRSGNIVLLLENRNNRATT